MANLLTFEETLNDLEEQLICVDARLLEEAERKKTLKDKIGDVKQDQANRAAESAQLIRQIAELECQVEDEECLGSISKFTGSKEGQVPLCLIVLTLPAFYSSRSEADAFAVHRNLAQV